MAPRDYTGVWSRGPRIKRKRSPFLSIIQVGEIEGSARCGAPASQYTYPFEFVDAGGCTHYRYINQLQTVPLYGPSGHQYWQTELPSVSWVCTCPSCIGSIRSFLDGIGSRSGLGANISGYGPVFHELINVCREKGHLFANPNGTFELLGVNREVAKPAVAASSSGVPLTNQAAGLATIKEEEPVLTMPGGEVTEELDILKGDEDAVQVDTSGVSSADEIDLTTSDENPSPKGSNLVLSQGKPKANTGLVNGAAKKLKNFGAKPKAKVGMAGADKSTNKGVASFTVEVSAPTFQNKSGGKSGKKSDRRQTYSPGVSRGVESGEHKPGPRKGKKGFANAGADAPVPSRRGNAQRNNNKQNYGRRANYGHPLFGEMLPYPFYDMFWAFYWMNLMEHGNFGMFNNYAFTNGWHFNTPPPPPPPGFLHIPIPATAPTATMTNK